MRHQLVDHGSGISSPATLSPTGCAASWRTVDSRDGTWNNIIGAVAAASPTDIWAVGNAQSPTPTSFGNGDENFAEHYDGRSWTAVTTPQPGPDANDLNGVAVVTSSDAWAVGISNTTGFIQSVALHWDGAAWSNGGASALSSPNQLNDVAAFASNDVWAVGQFLGDNGTGTYVQRTLTEHWNGTSWSVVASADAGSGNNALLGVGGSSSSDVWAVGFSRATVNAGRQSLIEHWNGSAWSIVPSPNVGADTLDSVAADSGTGAWAVGYYPGSNGLLQALTVRWNGSSWTDNNSFNLPSVYGQYLTDVVAVSSTEYWTVGSFIASASDVNAPFHPFASNWDGSGWSTSGLNGAAPMVAPGSDNSEVFTVATPTSGDVWAGGYFANPEGLSQNLIENYSGLAPPTGVAATPGDQSSSVSWTAPCGDGGSAITSYVVTAHDGCTVQGSMTVTGTPPATSVNFTGLSNGSPLTFTVAAVNGFGRGPDSAPSNVATPTGATAPSWVSACSAKQYTLTGNDGVTWQDLDPTSLTVSFTPAVDSYAVISGNADLWTANAGYNQDLGVTVSGGAYPSASGKPEAWKESGGFAGTFSPNAAYVQTVIPVLASTAYTAKLQWKSNKADPGTIFAAAGLGPAFSPTRLTVRLIPKSAAAVFTKFSTTQYHLTGNNGATWADMDSAALSFNFTVPASGYSWAVISGNADLWTANAGYNQDIGINLSGGTYPASADPLMWKESGGNAGTFSPNAAYAQAGFTVAAGTTYTTKLQWKANKSDPGTIYAAAGLGPVFSPTTLSVILLPTTGLDAITSTDQFIQDNSDGSYWQPLAPSFSRTASSGGSWLVTVNSDLWTSVPAYNQDIGIIVSGGAYGSGTLVAWKESGGRAGTFSPNAAFLSTVLQLQPATSYTVVAVWKANREAQESNAIWAGAGPINTRFSPTILSMEQVG